MADMARQLWVGNVPPGLKEHKVLHELAVYQIRPLKAVLRYNRPYYDGFAILHVSSSELASAARDRDDCRWSSGKVFF